MAQAQPLQLLLLLPPPPQLLLLPPLLLKKLLETVSLGTFNSDNTKVPYLQNLNSVQALDH